MIQIKNKRTGALIVAYIIQNEDGTKSLYSGTKKLCTWQNLPEDKTIPDPYVIVDSNYKHIGRPYISEEPMATVTVRMPMSIYDMMVDMAGGNKSRLIRDLIVEEQNRRALL